MMAVSALPSRQIRPLCHVVEVGVSMDSSQSPQNVQRHKDDTVPLVPGPAAVTAQPGGPTHAPNGWGVSTTEAPRHIDVTAEETCPAPAMPASDEAPQRAPAIQTAQAPSATTFELMGQLEALAHDLAVRERASSDQCTGNVHERSDFSAGLPAAEPSIRVSPRPAGVESDSLARNRPSIGRRTVLTLASFFMTALIGVGVTYAWQSHRAWLTSSPNDAEVAAGQAASSPSRQKPVSDAAPSQPVTPVVPAPIAPAPSPELAPQLEAMAQEIALVRRGVEQLAAKQEQLAAAQQQLEQLAAKQGQLAAKQEQMAQNIAKLQALEQNTRQKTSPPPQSRAVPVPPRVPSEPAAQLLSAPRPALHPVPPLPVPP
jgi:hypothetical protein